MRLSPQPDREFDVSQSAVIARAVAASGYTDAIDWGTQVNSGQFNASGDMIIEYTFAPSGGTFFGFPAVDWTDYEKQQVDAAFATFETFINVDFVFTANPGDAELTLNKVESGVPILGVMNPPGTPDAGTAGFNAGTGGLGWDSGDAGGNPTTGGLEQGGFGFVTLIHELGHGIGLAHPHDNGGGSSILPGVSDSNDPGNGDFNQGVFTMMSYVDGWQTHPDGPLNPFDNPDYGWVGTPMAVDIAVLQSKYGANTDYAIGDDVYVLPTTNGPGTFWSSIWDADGNDTIIHDGAVAAVIDLRPASLALEEGGGGWISWVDGIYGGYTIANGVVIENAIGGAGDDYLIGNAANNSLTGRGGADVFVFTIDGGGNDLIADFEDGIDRVDVSDLRSEYRLRDVTITSDLSGTTLSYGDNAIVFADIDQGDITKADFIFV